MTLLFAAPRISPDATSPDAIQATRWYQLHRPKNRLILVSGYVSSRQNLPPDAHAVDLCGRRGWGATWIWRAEVARTASRVAATGIVTTDPTTPRGGRVAILWLPAGIPEGEGWAEAAWAARARLFDRIVLPDGAQSERARRLGIPRDKIREIEPLWPLFTEHVPRSGPLRVLVLGRLSPGHGAHLAIDAVSRLPPSEKGSVHLTVAGPSEDPVYLSHLRHMALGQPVSVAPELQDAGRALAAADLALVPHLVGSPPARVVLEARALGLSVVATPAAFPDSETGIFVVAPEVGPIRDALIDAIRRPASPDLPARSTDPAISAWGELLHRTFAAARPR